jgi:alpha-D-glucose phosphate-specific phosphoglucomutase
MAFGTPRDHSLLPEIKFGTDGWRGVIADDFTFDNVRRVAGAVAAYVLKTEAEALRQGRGLVVGYDTRFASRRAAEIVSETLAAAGIAVKLSNDPVPTPGVSYAVKHFNAVGGVVVTSSHNPWNWNGLKYKAKYAGPATPAIMKAIEQELRAGAAPKAATPAKVEEADFKTPYIEAMLRFVDMQKIAAAGFKFGVDPLHGAGRGILAGIFRQHGVNFVEVHGELNPLFPGVNPEPIEPHVALLEDTVRREKCHAGFATDGDADRIGACDERGRFVDSHKIYSILLRWLLEKKKWPGAVVKTFSSTQMLNRIAEKHGRDLVETPIGFKYICDVMLEREVLIGGEESGGIGIARHLPERDGCLNALLLAAVMAEEGRTLAQLVDDLQKEFGPHYYGRRDLHVSNDIKDGTVRRADSGAITEVAGYKVLRRQNIDGVKVWLDAPRNGGKSEPWLLLRASGTEPLLRLYCEASDPKLVEQVLGAAQAMVGA